MRKRYALEEKRKIIINYIKKNPKATYKNIRRDTKLHPERCFKSLKEAFKKSRTNPPRTFERKTKEERKKIIIDYIKKHPGVGGHIIRKDTKVNYMAVFNSIKEAYKLAGVKYPLEREKKNKLKERRNDERKKQIIKLVKENPLIGISEITSKTKTRPYHLFRNMNEIYKEAGIGFINGAKKRRIKKQQQVINFIKKNTLATQREVNRACKTKVQDIFKKGIFEAYEKAAIKFPYERLKLYGIGIKEIRDRAKSFEDKIAIKLSGYGKVNRLVKTKRGFADIIFERKDKKAIIEVKDYQNKEISISQIKQLNKYLEDCDCKKGFLICHKKPKKDKFLIGKNKIFILSKEELDKIPKIL